jgi:hypothetical protein
VQGTYLNALATLELSLQFKIQWPNLGSIVLATGLQQGFKVQMGNTLAIERDEDMATQCRRQSAGISTGGPRVVHWAIVGRCRISWLASLPCLVCMADSGPLSSSLAPTTLQLRLRPSWVA